MCLQVRYLALLFKAVLIDRVELAVAYPEGRVVFSGAGAGNDLEGLVDAADIQQSARHLGGDGAISQLLVRIAGHVGVDIPLGVRNIRQDDRLRQLLVALHAVFGGRHETITPVLLEFMFGRCRVGPGLRYLLQMLQPVLAERLRRRWNDPVELAVTGLGDRVENTFGQCGAILGKAGRYLRDQVYRVLHDAVDRAIAVIRAFVDRWGQLQDGPEQFERFVRIMGGDGVFDNCQEPLQILDQSFLLAPVNEAGRAAQ